MLLLNKNLIKFPAFLVVLLFIQPALSQQLKRVSINTMGSVLSNESIALSQSVGQSSVVTKLTSNNTQLSQGFQQSNSSLLIGTDRKINVQLFPNPNDGAFQFMVTISRDEKFDYYIYDQVGRIISTGNAVGNSLHKVDISSKTISGSYHLKIKTADGSVGNSKLIITK